MKKIKNIMMLSLLAVVLSTTSCSDFLNVNTDPNRVTDANITPDLIFTQAENAIGTRQATRFVFLNNWMGYMGRSGTFVVDQMETTYQIDNSFTETNWDQAYNILFDLYQTRIKAEANKDSVLAGASIVLSVKLWQETVDQFGAIPYKQAFNYLKYPQPKYDQANIIYPDLLLQLDSAAKYLKAKAPSISFVKSDVIFARGSSLTTAKQINSRLDSTVIKWNKFANTIRLRLLLRQSEKQAPGLNIQAEIAKINANGGLLGVGDDVSVNPGYSNTTDRQNPFYGAFGLTPAGAPATSDNTANNYFVKEILNSPDDTLRLYQFYQAPVKGTDYGAQNGSLNGTVVTGTGLGSGLLGTPTSDQFIFPAFESLFLQAEALARGWAVGGDAQTVYESAVKANYRWLNVTVSKTKLSGAAITDSISASYLATNSKAKWQADAISLIVYQKYIALCCIDALEAWSDLRRGVLQLPTGYLSNNATAATSLPYVLTYPQTEFTTNSVNIPSPVRNTAAIFTVKEKLFWQP